MISLVLFTILFYILFTVFLWYILRFQIPPLIPIFWNQLFELINLIIDNKLKIKKVETIGNDSKVYYSLSHDVVTWDVDRDVSNAYC